MTGAVYERLDGDATLKMLDELTDLYMAIHNQPEHDFPMYSRDAFIERTMAQCQRDGFELVALRLDDRLIGFSFGLRFEAGKWWSDIEPPPAVVLEATKFAVIELDVHEDFRRRGLGKALMDQLLTDRPEPYATLAATVGGSAHAMYLRWGWRVAGRFTDGEPVMDALVTDLS
ncbi:GNAT family N-acetyltransferase [Kribbella sp. NPDC051718]|uniref:GNAT family N-acetyltransferase n=1 Tax=Kribbella sp. NPDC051718 TaxID=3155168 RepID=UPI0034263E52